MATHTVNSHTYMGNRRGLDTKKDWLSDNQLESDLDFGFKGLISITFSVTIPITNSTKA
jgi:hypothetical protein